MIIVSMFDLIFLQARPERAFHICEAYGGLNQPEMDAIIITYKINMYSMRLSIKSQ